jgi:hypothetical protein
MPKAAYIRVNKKNRFQFLEYCKEDMFRCGFMWRRAFEGGEWRFLCVFERLVKKAFS